MASSTDEDHSSVTPTNPDQQQPQQQQQPPPPQQHQFTAVNNAAPAATLANGSAPPAPMNGNNAGISAVATAPQQPAITASLFGGPATLAAPIATNVNGGRPSGSPEVQIPPLVGEETWNARSESMDPSVNGQKRKRTPEEIDRDNRAVSPTTQTQRHHLAAHEAALGVSSGGDLRAQSIHMQPEDSYQVDDHRFHDEGPSFRSTHGEGSPQPGEKRRKRVFSNRTKTGCITCRRRKKKCDEGKPECSNCKRGGFVCEGYSGKVSWQKPPGKSGSSHAGTPTLIQSKDHGDASASPTPIHQQRPMHTPQQPHTPSMAYSVSRTDDGLPADTPGSPTSATALAHRFAAPALETAYAATPQGGAAPSAPSSAVTTTGAQQQQQQQQQPRRLSFSHQALTAASGSLPRPRSEKDKMVNSELYHASAPELVREREMCKSACWRYNNAASNPSLGVSPAEKGRLLLDVLRPGKNWEVVNTGGATNSAAGVTYVSEHGFTSDIVDVTVDAPFTCSYGYNIRLGKNVYIEFGCTILDSCEVTIKARTILSPNVSIYSATHPIDPRKRNGSRGPEMAKRVLIEEDCWLGGNVIVLGGITIGKGSVVGAGSVVTRDVPPFTVVAGNPARVIRGIYQNGIDM